ncbi:hypothetical protein [Antribacter gilvus]|uniref:hypothetical protein n=1 Tax=Antribacter gilvus TaxID=2304675 RepID=UPI000F7A18D5|nr:hypothetical protein [Antribacter gilvus]
MDRPNRLALIGATALSGVAAVLGVVWLLGSLAGYYADPMHSVVGTLAGATAANVLHTVAALVGLAAGVAALAGALPRRAVVVTAVAEVLVFGFALAGLSTLSTVGYLVAMAMPVAVVVMLVQVVRRYPVARWTAGVPALLLLVVGVVVGRDSLVGLFGELTPALVRELPNIGATLLLVGVGAAWAATASTALSGSQPLERATAWVVRHRVAITIAAACGPLPYALIRLTWLSPWPMFGQGVIDDLPTRIWGVVLSSGAWLGFALTLGLIRPWGEVFPRWMPGLAGRTVPVAAAAVPGGAIAAVLTFSAVPLLTMIPSDGVVQTLASAVLFPCWFWGPMLALAVWGYVAHRRGVDGSLPEIPRVTSAA